MKLWSIALLLFFPFSYGNSQNDSLYVRISGDTAQIWDIVRVINCGSLFTFDVVRSGDTLTLTETDTSSYWVHCVCRFDLYVVEYGLNAGTYIVEVYRRQHYLNDTIYFVGTTSFTIESPGGLVPFVKGYQSPCGGAVGVTGRQDNVPAVCALYQAFPNPFNPLTTIRYGLPVRSHVSLGIYNLLGQLIGKLHDGVEDPGYRQVEWDGSASASGVYFYRLSAVSVDDPGKTYTGIKKIVLIK